MFLYKVTKIGASGKTEIDEYMSYRCLSKMKKEKKKSEV